MQMVDVTSKLNNNPLRTVVAEVIVKRGDGPLEGGGLMLETTAEDMVLKVLRQYVTICGTDGIVETEGSITLGHGFDYKVVRQDLTLKVDQTIFCMIYRVRNWGVRVRENLLISFFCSAWTGEGERNNNSKFTDPNPPDLGV